MGAGVKHSAGPSLKLLSQVKKKGLDVIPEFRAHRPRQVTSVNETEANDKVFTRLQGFRPITFLESRDFLVLTRQSVRIPISSLDVDGEMIRLGIDGDEEAETNDIALKFSSQSP